MWGGQITSPDGTAAPGARWAQAWVVGAEFQALACMRWRFREATCTREAVLRTRAASRPITSPNGTVALGAHWAAGWEAATVIARRCLRWRCRAATSMRGGISRRRAT